MKFSDKWWTNPTESESGRLILVTGRDGITEAIESGKYIFRVEVSLAYDSLKNGLPDTSSASNLEEVTDAFRKHLKKESSTLLTGIYTGDGRRDWIFYTRNLNIFNKILNSALIDLPQLPLIIEAYSDPDWEEYKEMREKTFIPEEQL